VINIKLWIIHKEGIGFSRIIAETLQDFLNDYIEVSVGNVNKIDPAFLVEENVDYLIIGDVIEGEKIPSPKLQDWISKFSELCKKNQLVIKSISSYYVSSTEIDIKHLWIKLFRENNISLAILPPVLQLQTEKGGLTLEKNVLKSVKDYSNDFIEFYIKKNGGK